MHARNEPPTSDQDHEDDEKDLEVKMALLAVTEDMGGPTTDVDLDALSPTEKRALLVLLRERLGLPTDPNRPRP